MIHDIISKIDNSKGTNAKLDILEENKKNKELKEFFRLAADPSISFFIKKIPKYKTQSSEIKFHEALKMVNDFSERKVTGNAAKNHLKDILENCGKRNAKVFERIIKKDPKCGIGIKSINKIWPELILTWPVMKCEKANEKNILNILLPALAQQKADGMRVTIVVAKYSDIYHRIIGNTLKKGNVLVKTANGNKLEICEHLKNQILYFATRNCVLDGEALVLENGEILPRKKGNGILNKSIRGTATIKDMSKTILHLWDIIEVEDFFNRKSEIVYLDRWSELLQIYKEKNIDKKSLSKISLIPTKMVKSINEAKLFSIRQIKNGFEGAILKNINSIWEDTRSEFHLKFKAAWEADLRVIGYEPHKKKENCIGSLICASECGKIQVSVGSGLKKYMLPLEYYYNEFHNSIVEVEFNEIIDSKGKKEKSMFLPVFVEIRKDKDTAETLEEINEKIIEAIKSIEKSLTQQDN